MIDVNKITSTLAKLPDQQLQQYAQMHKSDPYIMALAMSESNRRKEMRAAGQGGQGMQEQPKVVDQEIARMGDMQNASPEQMARLSQLLEARKQAEYREFTGGGREQPIPQQQQQLPEDQGIGQLPAGEMNFAGGGIIAFADGGDVERYSGQFGSLTGASLDAARARAQAAQQRLYTYGLRQRQQDPLGFQTAQQELATAQAALQNAEQGYGAEMAASGVNRAAFGRPSAPTLPAPTAPAAAAPADNLSGMDRRLMAGSQPSIAAFQTPLPPKDKGKGADKTERGAPTDKTATPAAAPTEDKGASGLDALVNNFTRSTELAQGALRNQRAGIASQFEQEALGAQEEGEKRRAARGDVFAKKEERLAEREKSIAGLGDKYMGLALLQAGAAMMSTPGNLGSVIGKGIAVGSERYIAGIDKINAAKDKFAEARDRLDDLRLNRDDMNEKEVRDENRAIRNARLQGQQLLVDGATKDLEISNANQKAIFGVAADSILTDKRIEAERRNLLTRESGANVRNKASTDAALQGPERMAYMAELEKTKTKENPQGDPAAAYQRVVAMKREPQTSETLLKAWSGNVLLQQQYPNPQDYIKMMVGSAGGASQLSPADAALVNKYSR